MQKKSILFVDDEETATEIGKKILEKFDYEVTAIKNPIIALESFRQAPQKFDLVITDYNMPQMNGDKLAMKLHDIRGDIPIILSTGCHTISKKTIRVWGIDQLIFKPYQVEELISTVKHLMKYAFCN